MPKTITIRINDDIYEILKKAADGDRRSISNYIEYAALAYLTSDAYVSENEMAEILKDTTLVNSLKKGLSDVKKGSYKIVGWI